jgi:TP901 family phage tail tape measure protein
MAKRIVDEEMHFDVIVNGDNAKKELFDLEKSTRKLTEENKALGLQKKLLEKQNKQETEEYKLLTKTIRENNKEIKENKSRMSELQKQIGITGLTMGQLSNKANELKLKLRNLVPGSADHTRYTAELRQITGRINELSGRAQVARMSLSSLADSFNKYQALAASFLLVITGVVVSLQKMIDYNGKLSDAQADVMKTTRMNKEEVDELTKSFGLFQSRTSRMDMLGIAEQGGRIGIAKDKILEFVQVMDKASIALGDSFTGGPEEVAEKLGKIKFLFEETKNLGVEEAYMSIGSAINDLGADGVASERNIAEFTTRIGSLTDVLKPTVAETLALGAAFEESGIEAEVSSRAYNIFMKQAATNADKFGQVMGKSRKEVEDLINANPLEFMLQFSEGLKGMDATSTAKTLDYLGLNADGANKAIGAMGNNTARFRELLVLSNNSFREGTSLVNEFNIKNNDLAATLEKIKKKVTGWFSSEGLIDFLAAAAKWFGKVIGATDDADRSGQAWRNTLAFTAKALAVVIAALLTATTWMKLTAIWTSRNTEATLLYNLGMKARAVLEGISIVATQAWAAAQMLLRGNIVGATQALRVMATTMMTTPWGLILGFVAAVATAYVMFSDSTDKAARQQKIFSDLTKEVEGSIRQEKDQLAMLLKIARDKNASDEVRKKAIEDINRLSPEYLGNITLENINTKESNKSLELYVKQLEKVARAKAVASKLTELYSQMLDLEKSSLQDNVAWYEHLWSAIKSGGNATLMAEYSAKTGIKNKAEAKKEIQETIDLLLKEQANNYNGNTVVNADATVKSKFKVPDAAGDKEAEKARKKELEEARKQREKLIEDAKKYQEQAADLDRKAMDERLALMEEGFDKDSALEDENHRRKLADLQKQLVSEADIYAAQQKIEDPATPKIEQAYWSHILDAYLEKNKHINQLVEIEHGRHELKMGAISEQSEADRIKKLGDKYDLESLARETAHNAELLALGNDELAKAALQDKFDQEEMDRQVAHLNQLLQEKENILAGGNNSIDLSLLTPEQRADFEKEVAELKKKISEVLLAKQGLSAKGGTDDFGDAMNSAFGDVDIFGFTADQWKATFDSLDTLSEKLAAVRMVVDGLKNIWGKYSDVLNANEDNQLKKFEKTSEARKRKLQWQLDHGLISQGQYKRATEKIEAETERKKAEIEYKQAKRKKATSIVETIMNTSIAIMQAYAQLGPIGGTVAAALMGTLGLLQIKNISQQPLPARGYEEGLYQDVVREQDGKVFRSRYGGKTKSGVVNRPTHFLTGENGPEMIIDAQAYRALSPETKAALLREIRGIKGFENGYYNNDVRNPNLQVPAGPAAPAASGTVSNEYLLSVINRNSEVLERALNEGFTGYFSRDFRDLKKMKDELDRLENSKAKAKI